VSGETAYFEDPRSPRVPARLQTRVVPAVRRSGLQARRRHSFVVSACPTRGMANCSGRPAPLDVQRPAGRARSLDLAPQRCGEEADPLVSAATRVPSGLLSSVQAQTGPTDRRDWPHRRRRTKSTHPRPGDSQPARCGTSRRPWQSEVQMAKCRSEWLTVQPALGRPGPHGESGLERWVWEGG
jgi:hypothetical protein